MAAFVSAVVVGGAALALGATAGTALAVGAGAALFSGQQQAKKAANAQSQAAQQATQFARQQADQADQAINRANQKRPNVSSLTTNNRAVADVGGGTLLTGPTGVDPNQLQLGKSTLLGS